MSDFISLVKEILDEKNKTVQDLFNDNVVSENTFYKYKHRYPSLKTLIKIANYLCVTVDYLFELSNENNFKPYAIEQNNLYDNIIRLIEKSGISQRKFSKDLQYSRVNLLRWKKGIMPNVQSLIEISKYFNIPINDLLEKENINYQK